MKHLQLTAIATILVAIVGAYAILRHVYRLSDGQKNFGDAQGYRAKAEHGDINAQYEFGKLYFEGKGVPQDYRESVRWYRTAADQGYAPAQSPLGFMYEQGLGVSKDYAEALRWYRTAAEQGDPDAEYNLGTMYRVGMGVSRDFAEAVKWYRAASGQGDANAQYGLGFMYYNGEGVQRDFAVAARLYGQAADQGLARAQYDLAYMYRDGQGVAQNKSEADSLLRQAAARGEPRAQRSLGMGGSVTWGRRQIVSLVIFLGCLLFLLTSAIVKKRGSRRDLSAGVIGMIYALLDLFVAFGHKTHISETLMHQVSFVRYMFLGVFSTMLILIMVRGRHATPR